MPRAINIYIIRNNHERDASFLIFRARQASILDSIVKKLALRVCVWRKSKKPFETRKEKKAARELDGMAGGLHPRIILFALIAITRRRRGVPRMRRARVILTGPSSRFPRKLFALQITRFRVK